MHTNWLTSRKTAKWNSWKTHHKVQATASSAAFIEAEITDLLDGVDVGFHVSYSLNS